MTEWLKTWMQPRRARALVTGAVALLVFVALYATRRALLPFFLGTLFAYILLPIVNLLNSVLPARLRRRGLWRGISVLAIYLILIAALLIVLAFIIPPIADQIARLAGRLPDLAVKIYNVVPRAVQEWLDKYNQAVPENIRSALQAGLDNMVQSLVAAIQSGVIKTVGVVFSTLSFVLGLLVIPLWMFFVLRDQPHIADWFHQLIPTAYHEDADNLVNLADAALGAYLRGRLILGLSMSIMCNFGLVIIGIDSALLLGTVAGLFEIVPLLGPILGITPILLFTLATAPSQLLWVLLLVFLAQQTLDYVLVPLVARGTVGLHPALVMLVIVIGSELAGVWGVLLAVPFAAMARDVVHYTYLRLSDQPLSPREAIAHVNARL